MKNVLFAILAIATFNPASAGAGPPWPSLAAEFQDLTGVTSARVYRVSDFVTDVLPETLMNRFNAEAYVRDPSVVGDLMSAIKETRNYGACRDAIEPHWALQLLSDSGKPLHTIMWESGSTCAVVDDRHVSISPHLEYFIRRTFSFMNI